MRVSNRLIGFAAAATTTCSMAAFAGGGIPLQLSEVRIDQPGADADEYVEISGKPNASLSGLTFITLGDGASALGSGVIEHAIPLTGQFVDPNGYFVIAETTFTLGTQNLTATLDFENSDNLTHLLVAGFTGADGDDLDTNDDGILDVTPWTEVIDAVGMLEEPNPPSATEFAYGASLGFVDVGPDGPFVPGHIYRCDPDGDWEIGGFDPAGLTDTPGAINLACSIDADGDGIPDDVDNCEFLFNPNQHDCDENGVGDLCEIADGTQFDVNGNNIPDSCESGLVINEIHFDAATDTNGDGVTNNDDDYVEFYNNTGFDLDISGWTVEDDFTTRHTFPSGTVIPADCALLLFDGGNVAGRFQVLAQSASTGALFLDDGGDSVRVRDLGGILAAEYNYTPEAPLIGESLNRDPDGTGGNPMVPHSTVVGSAGALLRPATRVDGSLFAGCPAVTDLDADGIFEPFDNCELFNPDQLDCDMNGVGDACQIADNPLIDCDMNGIIDLCEILNGDAADCNNNFIPDTCDIDNGTLTDANMDGFPDECEVEPPAVTINEIRLEQAGTDNDEFFELAGAAGTDLTGARLVIIGDGAAKLGSGVIEGVVNLDGTSVDANGFFLCAEDTFTLNPAGVDLVLPSGDLNFEGSDNVTYVLVANFFGAVGQDLDTNDDGVLDVIPWVDTIDAVAAIEEPNPPLNTEFAYGAALGGTDVGPDGSFVPAHIYLCNTWQIGTFDAFDPLAADTPDAVNGPDCGGTPCPADVDGSGTVNFDDLVTLLANWGVCTGCPADIDDSGIVNFDDLVTLLANWGPCP